MTDTMKDVTHTAPHETSADGVWERGNEKADEDDDDPVADDD